MCFFGAGVSTDVPRFALNSDISVSSGGVALTSVLGADVAAGNASLGNVNCGGNEAGADNANSGGSDCIGCNASATAVASRFENSLMIAPSGFALLSIALEGVLMGSVSSTGTMALVGVSCVLVYVESWIHRT